MSKFITRNKCRLCGQARLLEVLNLGEMPPANAFLKEGEFEGEEVFPLAVNLCENCFSLQLKHTVSPELLFKNYHYMTGASKPLTEHFYVLADHIVESHIDSPNDLVVEIGSNDGVLLSRIKDKCRVLGVDPADNVALVATKAGVPTRIGFFDTELAEKIKNEAGEAKVVVANNVMAHIDNLRDVFQGVKNLLSPDGKFIFEVHWVGNLLTVGGFDQIYHEHIYYHSLHTLKALLEFLGMRVLDVKSVPIHGESIRVYAGAGESSKAVSDFLKRESDMELNKSHTYTNFSQKVEKAKKDLLGLLSKFKKENKKIVGYGAPAKGNTLLNYVGIGPEFLDYITDTTSGKQGTFTPGTHIKVVHPCILQKETPDYILLLSWNYTDAILEKEKSLRDRGAKFIIPVPEVRIV